MTIPSESMQAAERKRLIDLLAAENCSCVIGNGAHVRIFRERGIKDLFRLLKHEPRFLEGAFVADKVVGKGAAALMILGGVREVFAGVVSRAACGLFEKYGVTVVYAHLVPQIANRMRTDICPVEKLCAACATAEECLPLIEKFVASLQK